jgi:hypothetical protein
VRLAVRLGLVHSIRNPSRLSGDSDGCFGPRLPNETPKSPSEN